MKNKKANIINFPSNITKLEKQVEAILFAAAEPLEIETIQKRVESNSNIQKLLEKIQKDYSSRGINLICKRNKWSFRTSEDLSNSMALQKSTQKKLSKSTIETLSIIVYHQQKKKKFGKNTNKTKYLLLACRSSCAVLYACIAIAS